MYLLCSVLPAHFDYQLSARSPADDTLLQDSLMEGLIYKATHNPQPIIVIIIKPRPPLVNNKYNVFYVIHAFKILHPINMQS